jgi:hypothetical protein
MGSGFQGLRLVASVGLACGITWAICHGLGLGEATPYGVVIAAVMVRPRFDRWPRPVFVLLPLVVMVGLTLGTLLKPLLEGPQFWEFAIVSGLALTLGQALPDKLAIVRNLITVAAVLPLLNSNATWLGAWHQTLAVVWWAWWWRRCCRPGCGCRWTGFCSNQRGTRSLPYRFWLRAAFASDSPTFISGASWWLPCSRWPSA